MVEGLSRLFVAVPLTDEARHALSATILQAAPHGLPGRAVRPPNWHLTLRFLGDAGSVGKDRISAALDQADLGPAFSMVWGGLGAFPRPQRATVLWVGADRGGDDLERLAGTVEAAAQEAGFPIEERPFQPHLTLSRIRPHQDVGPLLATDRPGVPMEVGRIVLYRSHLGRGGARYEEIEEFPLG
ncbi:MAG: RNA 2',3'-cyclic phosphodiesterase [Acidimicrobiia bacterium]|nr:RNA 2',3'-cyclic phosphodiesterase [Acidimicrobiia bacterium]